MPSYHSMPGTRTKSNHGDTTRLVSARVTETVPEGSRFVSQRYKNMSSEFGVVSVDEFY
jgi:hypothetical protein